MSGKDVRDIGSARDPLVLWNADSRDWVCVGRAGEGTTGASRGGDADSRNSKMGSRRGSQLRERRGTRRPIRGEPPAPHSTPVRERMPLAAWRTEGETWRAVGSHKGAKATAVGKVVPEAPGRHVEEENPGPRGAPGLAVVPARAGDEKEPLVTAGASTNTGHAG